jgi:hypothetical protein
MWSFIAVDIHLLFDIDAFWIFKASMRCKITRALDEKLALRNML